MRDRDINSAGPVVAPASELVGIAEQLAALAQDIKALAGKPMLRCNPGHYLMMGNTIS